MAVCAQWSSVFWHRAYI